MFLGLGVGEVTIGYIGCRRKSIRITLVSILYEVEVPVNNTMSRNKRVKSSRSDSDGYISIRSNCVRSNRSSKVLTMN